MDLRNHENDFSLFISTVIPYFTNLYGLMGDEGYRWEVYRNKWYI